MLTEINHTLQNTPARLIAVSKTHPPEKIMALYEQGQRAFGENKAQEMLAKYQQLPKDIEWHLIGHLQTNKVKMIAPFVAMIHAVDSLRLLLEIDKEARKNQRRIPCLLQFHIAQEETKFGLDLEEAIGILQSSEYPNLQYAPICGVMGMASFTDDQQQVQREFQTLKSIFDTLKERFFPNNDAFREISMGMSGDWELAVQEGSTMVRIGSLLFGER